MRWAVVETVFYCFLVVRRNGNFFSCKVPELSASRLFLSYKSYSIKFKTLVNSLFFLNKDISQSKFEFKYLNNFVHVPYPNSSALLILYWYKIHYIIIGICSLESNYLLFLKKWLFDYDFGSLWRVYFLIPIGWFAFFQCLFKEI